MKQALVLSFILGLMLVSIPVSVYADTDELTNIQTSQPEPIATPPAEKKPWRFVSALNPFRYFKKADPGMQADPMPVSNPNGAMMAPYPVGNQTMLPNPPMQK